MDFSSPSIKTTSKSSQKISEIVDAALVAAREAEPKRFYLGGSRLGHPMALNNADRGCDRALWYEWKKYPSERPFDGDLYRIFDMGHDAEKRLADYLRLAGFDLKTEKENGGQFGFAVAPDPETGEPRVKGHLDGIIVSGPEVEGLTYPALWECKGMNNKKWSSFTSKGVEKSHPVYYGQCQTYMGFKDLKSTLFTALNRDSGEIGYEVIPFNEAHAQASVERAARVIAAAAATELSRVATDVTHMPCKWCSYAGQCQKDEAGRAAQWDTSGTQTPEWML